MDNKLSFRKGIKTLFVVVMALTLFMGVLFSSLPQRNNAQASTEPAPQSNTVSVAPLNTTVGMPILDLTPVNAAIKAISASAVDLAKSAVEAAGSAAVSALIPVILELFGFKDAYTLALERINEQLTEINNKLDELASQISNLQTQLIRQFANLEVSASFRSIRTDVNRVHSRLYELAVAEGMVEGTARDERISSLTVLHKPDGSTTDARLLMDSVNNIIVALDPGTQASPVNDSVTRLYYESLKINTPFYHNVAHLMENHLKQWSVELYNIKIMAGVIYTYNAIANPNAISQATGINTYIEDLQYLENRINTAITNMKNVTDVKYKRALQNVTNRDDQKIRVILEGHSANSTFRYRLDPLSSSRSVVLNSNSHVYTFAIYPSPDGRPYEQLERNTDIIGRAFLRHLVNENHSTSHVVPKFSNSLSDFSINKPISSEHFLNYAETLSYDYFCRWSRIAVAEGGTDTFFTGTESVMGQFANGASFNDFMLTNLQGVVHRVSKWWNPERIIIGYHLVPPGAHIIARHEVYTLEANTNNTITRIRMDDDKLIDIYRSQTVMNISTIDAMPAYVPDPGENTLPDRLYSVIVGANSVVPITQDQLTLKVFGQTSDSTIESIVVNNEVLEQGKDFVLGAASSPLSLSADSGSNIRVATLTNEAKARLGAGVHNVEIHLSSGGVARTTITIVDDSKDDNGGGCGGCNGADSGSMVLILGFGIGGAALLPKIKGSKKDKKDEE